MKIGDLVKWLDSLDATRGTGIILETFRLSKYQNPLEADSFIVYTSRDEIETFNVYELTLVSGKEK